MTRLRTLSLFLLCAITLAAPAHADDDKAQTPEKKAPEKAVGVVLADNPHLEAIEKAAVKLAKTLSETEIDDFVVIKNNFGMIRAVRVARTDIKNAVEACGAANPDMAEDINETFTAWDETAGAGMRRNEQAMESIIKQNFDAGDSKKIHAYLDLIDKAATFADNKIDKNPVTSEKACKKLMRSMKKSDGKLVRLMDDIVWPAPRGGAPDTPETDTDEAG